MSRVAPTLVGLLVPLLLPVPGAEAGAAVGGSRCGSSPCEVTHELHESYADLAIEGGVVAGRVQLFKKDLEAALGPLAGADAVTLAPGPEADALVLRYLTDRLRLEAAGEALEPALIRAEEIRLGHHPGWEVTLSWEATAPIDALRVHNTLLFDLHDDQRNIMRFVRFPGQTRETVTTEPGAEEAVVGGAARS